MIKYMDEQKIALVTGANKGIGYEIAAGVDAFGVPLDVSDDASVTGAAQLIEERAGRLDVLVNNAGITGGWPQEPTTLSAETMRAAVETNVIGVIRVINAMLPLLRRSASPRIVNQSSHVASLTLQTTPGIDLGPVSGAYTRQRRSSTPSPSSTPRRWPAPTS